MYYRGANAALLLYDITNASTFDDIRGWLEGEARQLWPYWTDSQHVHGRVEEKLSV
jgi:hypothetical protein